MSGLLLKAKGDVSSGGMNRQPSGGEERGGMGHNRRGSVFNLAKLGKRTSMMDLQSKVSQARQALNPSRLFRRSTTMPEGLAAAAAAATGPEGLPTLKREPMIRRSSTDENTSYILTDRIGEGATASVYLCHPAHKPERILAMKVLKRVNLAKMKTLGAMPGDLNKETGIDMVMREIAIMKKLQHPNIITLYEVIEHEESNTINLVMEYMKGGPTMTFNVEKSVYESPKGGVLPAQVAATYIHDVFSGLRFLHRHDIVHMDLKPENCLVDGRGRVKLADFGMAHHLAADDSFKAGLSSEMWMRASIVHGDNKYSTNSTGGTPAFWSPESCAEDTFNAVASDVWAAGVTLFCFCFGTPPFMGNNLIEVMDAIEHKDPPFPAIINHDLKDLLQNLLNKNPSQRMTLAKAAMHNWITRNIHFDDIRAWCTDEDNAPPPTILAPDDIANAISTRHIFTKGPQGESFVSDVSNRTDPLSRMDNSAVSVVEEGVEDFEQFDSLPELRREKTITVRFLSHEGGRIPIPQPKAPPPLTRHLLRRSSGEKMKT